MISFYDWLAFRAQSAWHNLRVWCHHDKPLVAIKSNACFKPKFDSVPLIPGYQEKIRKKTGEM